MPVKIPKLKILWTKGNTRGGTGYCYSFTWCLVMRRQMPHNQIPVPLRIPGREVQRSWRRLWKEWVKGAEVQFWVRRAGLCRLPSPNILAMSQAAFGVFPLNGGPICHPQVWVDSMWLSSISGWFEVDCQFPGLLSVIICNVSPLAHPGK